jgi:hypothetical protein
MKLTVHSATPVKLLNFTGQSQYDFMVAATAVYRPPAVPICLLALDKNAAPGILFKGNGSFVGTDCVIWSDSTSVTQSIYLSGSANVSALLTCASGKIGTQGAAKIPSPAQTGCANFADPLASWTPSSVSTGCTNPPMSGSTMSPGVYCSAVVINGGDITMSPGVYVIKDHKFTVNATGKIKGSGVQILLMGNSFINMTSGAELELSGIVDAGGNKVLVAEYGSVSSNTSVFTGNSKLSLDGIVHLPSQEVQVTGNATVTLTGPASSIIARTIVVDGSGTIQYPGSAKGVSPQPVSGLAALRVTE